MGVLSMPVIMMSGHATIDTAVEATKIGAQAFLEKPITLQKLLKAVETGLTKRSDARSAKTSAKVDLFYGAGQVGVGGATSVSEVVAFSLQATQNFTLDKPLREARDDFEKAYFEYHLERERGSMTRVAEKTGLERTHLYRKLKQLGVDLLRGKRTGSDQG